MRAAWVRPVVLGWVVSRVVYLAAAELSAQRIVRGDAIARYPAEHFWDTLVAWDGQRYLDVGRHGYDAFVSERAGFFPLVPLVSHLGVGAALVVANVAGLLGLLAAAAVTERIFDAEVARRTGLCLACFPLSYVLSMLYTEPFALALGFGAVALLLARRPLSAIAPALLVGLTRSTAILFVLPLGWAALDERRSSAIGRAAAVAAPVVGLGLVAAYMHARMGDALAFQHAQRRYWSRRTPGLAGLRSLIDNVRADRDFLLSASPYLSAGYVASLVGVARRIPFVWLLYGLATVLVPLSTGRFAGAARYGLLALPAFWGLALLAGRWPRLARLYYLCGPIVGALEIVFWLPQHTP